MDGGRWNKITLASETKIDFTPFKGYANFWKVITN